MDHEAIRSLRTELEYPVLLARTDSDGKEKGRIRRPDLCR